MKLLDGTEQDLGWRCETCGGKVLWQNGSTNINTGRFDPDGEFIYCSDCDNEVEVRQLVDG